MNEARSRYVQSSEDVEWMSARNRNGRIGAVVVVWCGAVRGGRSEQRGIGMDEGGNFFESDGGSDNTPILDPLFIFSPRGAPSETSEIKTKCTHILVHVLASFIPKNK